MSNYLERGLMGFIESIKRKFSSAAARRTEEAADQLWAVLLSGVTLEIPAIHSTDSDITQAILRLREKRPNVFVNFLQSKSIVLTLGSGGKLAVSDEANQRLGGAGYFPDAVLPANMLFEHHARFQKYNARVSPAVAAKEALEAQRKQDAITVGAVGTAPAAPEVVPAPPEPVAEPVK